MKVKIKKLHENAIIPKYAKLGDCGLDLTATSFTPGRGFMEYGTGLAIEIPEGYVGLIFPRSSISNKALTLANSVGVIDSGYRGEIKCRFYSANDQFTSYNLGDRIAQLVILPYPEIELEEIEELSETERSIGGFGSTNNI